MSFTPRQYADMAIYLADDIDLGNASQSDLDDLAAKYLADALVRGATFRLTYPDGSTEVI